MKDLIGFILLLISLSMATGLLCSSKRFRDIAFFLIVILTAVTERVDINFLSHYWYRGTTRGIEISLVDVLACSLLVSTLISKKKDNSVVYWPGSLAGMLLLLLYCSISVLTATPKIYGVFELSKLVRGIIIFLAAAFYLQNEKDYRKLATSASLVLIIEALFACKQRLLGGMYRVTGTLDHANSLSMYICMMTPFVIATEALLKSRIERLIRSLGILSGLICIFLTISRAGLPIFAMVCLASWIFTASKKITIPRLISGALAFVFVCIMLVKSWDSIRSRYGEATLGEEYGEENIEGRGFYLRLSKSIIQEHPLGIGLNNWSYWVSKKYGNQLGGNFEDYDDLGQEPDKDELNSFRYAAPAHNLAALMLGEIGIPGFLVFGCLWLRWLSMPVKFFFKWRTHHFRYLALGIFFGFIGVALQSLTEWVFRQTTIFLMFHIFVGALASIANCYSIKSKPAPSPANV